jgi:hypothetical protein
MIWSQVKEWVASRNVTFEPENVKLLCEQKFSEMGEREWRPVCDHVEIIEKEYLETEGIIDVQADRLIISLGGSASDSYDSSDTEAEDDVVSDDQLSGIEDLA